MPPLDVGPVSDVASFNRLLREGLASSLDDALAHYRQVDAALAALPALRADYDAAVAAIEAHGRRRKGRAELEEARSEALGRIMESLEWPTGDVDDVEPFLARRKEALAGAARPHHPVWQRAASKVGQAPFGVYAFYDFDGIPMYVGRTREGIGSRFGRHLTNQRTDAVAMGALEPMEVAEVEVWPLWDNVAGTHKEPLVGAIAQLEHAVKCYVDPEDRLLFNQKSIPDAGAIEIPASYRFSVIQPSRREALSHPDLRIARRTATIARLAGKIADRELRDIGLRRSLERNLARVAELSRARYLARQGIDPDDTSEAE